VSGLRVATPDARAAAGPRPVLCVIEHEHRDLEVAEAVAAGRFTHTGITCELGLEPDWLGADLPEDEEWRIEWCKFYYGLNLAHAFATTSQRRFLTAWERLVGSFVEQVPVGWDVADVAGRRLQNWIYAWQAFAAAPAFDGLAGGLDGALRASIAEQARFVRDNLAPERNHRTLELYALLIVALALPDDDPDGALARWSLDELHRNLLEDFRADGVHREASTHYHMIALRSFVGAREQARRFGLELPAGFEEHLGRACDFAMHCVRPDGGIPALSDADGGNYDELLAMAAGILRRGDLRHVATRGREGAPPRERHASFPTGGYHVQRSGWGDGDRAFEDERYLIFDCGPLGDGGHGHYDALSVEIAAGGGPLVVDPGRYTYAEGAPNLRRWFRGTAAHNTVCVDATDQTPYRRKKPKGPVADARFLGRLTGPGLDVLRGEVASPVYEARHERTVTFVADAYWVIADRVRGEREHRCDARWHLAPGAQARTRVEAGGDATTILAPGLALAIAGGPRVTLQPGWVAPLYGIREPAPVVSAVADGADVALCALFFPLDDGRAAPTLRVRHSGPWTVFEVRDGDGLVDEIALAASPAPIELGPLRAHAQALWLRRDRDGAPLSATACAASAFALPGAECAEPAGWVAWDREHALTSGGGPA
jgi:heparinase II/III-like protein